MNKKINEELKSYIEKNILPQYCFFDKGHGPDHIRKVIVDSLILAKNFDVDINMVYTVASYHDTGIATNRELHHVISGEKLSTDENLKKWFTQQQIETMKQAVEDHRASNSYEPRSIYGKIVAEADRDISVQTILRRTLQFGLAKYPDADFNFHFDRAYSHIVSKYGENGYLKLYLHSEKNEKGLAEIRSIIKNKDILKKMFKEIFEKM